MYLRRSVRTNFSCDSTSGREWVSAARRAKNDRKGREGREEQQGPSSENADRLTGLLRPAETNKQTETGGRQAKERTQEYRDGLSSHSQSFCVILWRGDGAH